MPIEDAVIVSEPKIPELKIDTLSYALTAKENPKDKIEVEIGDSKDVTQFQPQMKIMRWDNEVNFSARVVGTDNADEVITQDNEKIIWEKGDIKTEYYDLGSSEQHPEGAFEFNVILDKPPASNVLEFTIETKGLDFFYQPALTQQEIDEGLDRPENVVGSYAVYHKTKGGMNDSAGMEYKTGKAFHIFRPEVSDSKGNKVWGELNVDVENKLLTVTIPQKFLDKAVYPVIVDPTFGFGQYGSTFSANPSYMWLSADTSTPSEDGILTSLSAYTRVSTGSYGLKLSIYNATKLIDYTSAITVNSTSLEWKSENITNGAIVFTGTNYKFPWKGENANLSLAIDSGAAAVYQYDAESYSSAFPNPSSYTNGASGNYRFSIYATYTAVTSKLIKSVTVQGGGGSTSSTAYAASSSALGWTYTADNYDGDVYCYYEAILSTDNASYTAYSVLYDASAAVTGTEVSTTSTSATRVRSTGFAPVDGTTYRPRIKISNAAGTNTITIGRIIIVQYNPSAKTETPIRIAGNGTTTNTTAADCAAPNLWTYTASDWGGTVTAYFEAILNTNNASGQASAWLADTSNNVVTDSTVTSTTSTAQPVPVRSSAITLVDGTTYKARMKTNNASYTTTVRTARVIIVQTVDAIPTVSYVDLTQGNVTSTSTSGTSTAKPIYYDAEEFVGVTVTPELEGTLKTSDSGQTATLTLESGTVGSVGTSSTDNVIVTDTSMTLTDNTEYTAYVKTSDAGATSTLSSARVVYVITETSGGGAVTVLTNNARLPLLGVG